MGAGNKPRRVELDSHTLGRLGLRLRVVLRRPLALELFPGLAQGGAPPPLVCSRSGSSSPRASP
jgi:hypothetical protein